MMYKKDTRIECMSHVYIQENSSKIYCLYNCCYQFLIVWQIFRKYVSLFVLSRISWYSIRIFSLQGHSLAQKYRPRHRVQYVNCIKNCHLVKLFLATSQKLSIFKACRIALIEGKNVCGSIDSIWILQEVSKDVI